MTSTNQHRPDQEQTDFLSSADLATILPPTISDSGLHNDIIQSSNAFEKLPDGLVTTSNHALREAEELINGQLLEAVTSTAGEASTIAQPRNGDEEQRQPRSTSMDRQSRIAEEAVSFVDQQGKRKREDDARTIDVDDSVFLPETGYASKRQRLEETINVGTSDQPDSTPPPTTTTSDRNIFLTSYPNPAALSSARASGVYSAAALFRPPNAAVKKYTRPPMSKLFGDLELTPENFLLLQAEAKEYMLDDSRPERRACVGNRGKGDTDMVKLKLFHCVREFLEPGLGTRYFGVESEGAELRAWSWPADVNKVIAAVTPLLRRMVTNERQRQYAIESRKAGGGKKDVAGDAAASATVAATPAAESAAPPGVDPLLSLAAPNRADATPDRQGPTETPDALSLYIVLTYTDPDSASQQRSARLTCPAQHHPTRSSLMEFLRTTAESEFDETPLDAHAAVRVVDVRAFLPSAGLKRIADDWDWSAAQEEARGVGWLDGVLKVIVEVGKVTD